MTIADESQTTEYRGIQRWRFVLVLLVFALLFLVVLGRLFMLHTIEQPFLYEQGEKRTVRTEVQVAHRGNITDRFGQPLAVSTPVVNLWINPRHLQVEVPDPKDKTKTKKESVRSLLAQGLEMPDLSYLKVVAEDLGLEPSRFISKVEESIRKGRAFLYVKRQVEPDLAQRVLDRKIAGVYSKHDFRRFYPAAEVTAHTVGIVDIDGKGQEGIELAFDDYLQGENGLRKVVKDERGNIVKQLMVEKPVQQGQDLRLTLDMRLQYLAYRELKAAVQAHKAFTGSAVLLDAKNGEILALVSQPSYNPNNRSSLKPEQMRNRAVSDLIEPGSTMKPFTVAAALESGQYGLDTSIDTSPGYIRVRNHTIRDHRNYGVLDLTGIITKSSNVGVSHLARELGSDYMWSFFNKAGMGDVEMLGFPGEAIGRLPYPEEMGDVSLSTLSYGYGLSVSSLKLAEAYTSFVDGCRKPLRLLLDQSAETPCIPVMSRQNAHSMLAMLETVVTNKGTGRRAAVEGYRVGGKTGTVHKVGRLGYEQDQYSSMFAGLAPLTDPELVLVVVVNRPQGKEYYGGEVAAPIFSRIMEQALRLRQVVPDEPTEKQTIQMVAGGSQ